MKLKCQNIGSEFEVAKLSIFCNKSYCDNVEKEPDCNELRMPHKNLPKDVLPIIICNKKTRSYLNPSSQRRDQNAISLYNINTILVLRVKRLKICLNCSIEKMETKNSLNYVALVNLT